MQPEILKQYLKREPFQPFRVRLRDGRTYEVRYPAVTRVWGDTILIGTPVPDPAYPDVAASTEYVSTDEIERVEFMTFSPAPP